MAIRYIKQSELNQYMRDNPHARAMGAQQAQPRQAQEPQRGFLEDILMGVTSPLRGMIGAGVGAGKTIMDIAGGQGDITERLANAPAIEQNIQDYGVTMTPEERSTYARNPLLGGLKQAAGFASYAIPGAGAGAGIGKQALNAALAGGVGGFGASREGKELEDTLSGAAFGGVLGGGLGLVGKGLSKIGSKTNIDNALIGEVSSLEQKGIINQGKSMGIKFNPKAADPFADIIERTTGAQEIAQKYGEKANLSGLSKARGFVNKEITNTLQGSTAQHSINDLVESIAPEAEGYLGLKSGDQAKNLIKSEIYKAAKVPVNTEFLTTQQLAKVKAALQDAAFKGGDTNRSVLQGLIHEKAYSALESAVPGIKPLYNDLHGLYGVTPDMARVASKGSSAYIPALGKVPTFGAPEALQNAFGGAQRGLGKLGRNLPSIAEKAGELLQSPLGRGAIPRVSALAPSLMGQPTPEQSLEPTPEDLLSQEMTGTPQDLLSTPEAPQYTAQDRMAAIKQVADMYGLYNKYGSMDASAAGMAMKIYPEVFADTGMDAADSKAQRQASILSKGIDQMEQLYGTGTKNSLSLGKYSTGPAGLLAMGGRAIEKATSQDYIDRLTAYTQSREIAVGLVNQARGAGVLNGAERDYMIASIPSENTSEAAAKSWFKNIRDLLVGRMQSGSYPMKDTGGLSDSQGNKYSSPEEFLTEYGY